MWRIPLRFAKILVPALLYLVQCTVAQGQDNSHFQSDNSVGLGYRQEFNTYLWNLNAGLYQRVSPKFHASFSQSFRTSMLRISSEDRWKDDQNLNLNLSYIMLPYLTLRSQIRSIIFLDKQSGFNNDVQSHVGKIGMAIKPLPQFRLNFLIGPIWDSRFNQNDRGWSTNFTMNSDQLDWEGYNNSLDFVFDQDQYDRRQNRNLLAMYRVSKRFTDSAADSLQIFVNQQRRDNYVSLLGDIESQREYRRGVNNALYYKVSKSLDASVETILEFKDVELLQYGETSEERRRKRNDQRFYNNLSLFVNRNHFNSHINIVYGLQEQRYDLDVTDADKPFSSRTAFITPDNSSSRLMMSAVMNSALTKRDSLSAYASLSKFQYDTPDTTNFDDRDELRINSRLSLIHQFDPSLYMELLVGVNLYHMVYIYGERSADNNWNRIFLLRPIIVYEPSENLKLHQSFEVLANYIDYDFENPEVQTRSFVFRKFAMTDSLSWHITRRSTLLLDYRLQLEENGQLYWDRWAEKVLVNRTKQWLHFYWRYSIGRSFQLSPGYTLYKRDEWRHSSPIPGTQLVEKAGTYISHGPILRILYKSKPNLHLVLDAVRYKVHLTDHENYYINNIELKLNWLF